MNSFITSGMFKAERLLQIKKLLLKKQQTDIQTLVTLLHVSIVTIRHDLKTLEEMGFLKRIHGGAIINPTNASEKRADSAYAKSITAHDSIKEEIGKTAAEYINSGEWIFLGEGGTCYNIAKALADKNYLNIITNNLHVVMALQSNPTHNIVITGGNLFHNRLCVGGELFTTTIRGLNVNKAFLGVAGVDLELGYTLSNVGENNIFQEVRKISKETIIVTGNNKFDNAGFIVAGDLTVAQTFITNEPIPQVYREHFQKYNVKVITSATK
jgi:DeoR/GlpR family transcriptional regulator of sugar metabolism